MLREPPLVEMPIAISSGCAWAINWRRKITSVPTSLASAVMFAGSSESETAGMGRQPAGGSDAIERPVVGVGGGAAVAEHDQLAAARDALRESRRPRCRDLLRHCSRATSARRSASSSDFHPDGIRHFFAGRPPVVLLLLCRGKDRGSRVADVLAEFAMFEEDVHGFPKRVVQDLDHLLVQETDRLSQACTAYEPPRRRAARTSSHRAPRRLRERAATSGSPSGGPKPIDDVLGADDRVEPGPEEDREIERGQARACRR